MEVKLEKLGEKDLDLVAKWRMLPEITKYMYTDPIITPESQRKWFNTIKNNNHVKYWIVLLNGVKVGLIFLTDIDYVNKRCYWGYYIAEQFARGKGLARILECNINDFAFYKLGLNKLCQEILAFNERVVAIHKKFGSEIEGVFKQHIYKNGEFHDVVCMGIIKEKWDKFRESIVYDKIEIEE